MNKNFAHAFLVTALALAIVSCGGGGGSDAPGESVLGIDQTVSQLAAANNVSADPLAARSLPSINDPVAQLGRALFFSKTLSGDRDVACASCHHPLLAGADELSLSVGVNPKSPDLLGLGRTLEEITADDPVPGDGPNVPRNAPTTFNIGLYDFAMFHDGRAFTLGSPRPNGEGSAIRTPDSVANTADPNAGANLTIAQARFPITSLFEMRGFGEFSSLSNDDLRNAIATRLRGNSAWVDKFRIAFNLLASPPAEAVTFDRVAIALAEYQRSQVFMNLPFFDFLKGNSAAIPDAAKQGAKLFYTPISQGGAGCGSCHSGSHFSNEQFYISGFPQLGRGKNTFGEDSGRREVTQLEPDRFRFRVPSLVNVARTAPYGHAGSFATLQQLIAYHVNPEAGLASYDFTFKQLPQFQSLGVAYPRGRVNTTAAVNAFKTSDSFARLYNPGLTSAQIEQLVAFLGTLTDPRLDNPASLQAWIAQGAQDNPDGQMLVACFSNPALGAPCTGGGGTGGTGSTPVIDLTEQPAGADPVVPAVSAAQARQVLAKLQGCGNNINAPGLNLHSRRFTPAAGAMQLHHEHGLTPDFWQLGVEGAMQAAGVNVGDLDLDCWPDLLFTAGSNGVWIYYNQQGKGLSASSALSGYLGNVVYGAGVGDLDGDYKDDLVLGGFRGGRTLVLKNDMPAGFVAYQDSTTGIRPRHNSIGYAFGDFDNDGDIDLLSSHWTLKTNIERSAHLRENLGGMRFSARDSSKGLISLVNSNDFTFSPGFADMNGDGWADILMASDFENTQIYLNNHNGFTRATDTNVITDENGMGSAIADYDNDGDLDWFITAIHHPAPAPAGLTGLGISGNRLYLNNGAGVLSDNTSAAGVREGAWGWGACAADFDNDGDQDIFHVNGYAGIPQLIFDNYLTPELRAQMTFLAGIFAQTPARLLINDGMGHFVDQAPAWGIDDRKEGRGVSCGDFDRDGDVDIVIANNSSSPSFYLNQSAGMAGANFIDIRLQGVSPNTAALGAKVRIKAGGVWQMREINLNSNYLSNNLPEAHFGLGAATVVEEVVITWPREGGQTRLLNVGVNQFLVVAHPDL